jgi:hypothetical protein
MVHPTLSSKRALLCFRCQNARQLAVLQCARYGQFGLPWPVALLQQLLTMGSLISSSLLCSTAAAGLYQALFCKHWQLTWTASRTAQCCCWQRNAAAVVLLTSDESAAADDNLASVFGLLLHVDNTINTLVRSTQLNQQLLQTLHSCTLRSNCRLQPCACSAAV